MHVPRHWSSNAIAAPHPLPNPLPRAGEGRVEATKVGFGLAPIKPKVCSRWISYFTAIVAQLWLRMARAHEKRRMRVVWATIDDRTLRDIGVSRWEIAYVGVRRAPLADMKVTQLCNKGRGSVASGPQPQAVLLGCPKL
jgi:uncharacterized protein YjiS (DUF1127 family)